MMKKLALVLSALASLSVINLHASDEMIEVSAADIGLKTEINAGTYATPVIIVESKDKAHPTPIIIPVGESLALAFTPALKLSFPQGPALSLGLLIGDMKCSNPDAGDACLLQGALIQFRPTFFGTTRWSMGVARIEYSPANHPGAYGPFFTDGYAVQATYLETSPGSPLLGAGQKFLGAEVILPSGVGHTGVGLMIRLQGSEPNEAWIPTVEWGVGF